MFKNYLKQYISFSYRSYFILSVTDNFCSLNEKFNASLRATQRVNHVTSSVGIQMKNSERCEENFYTDSRSCNELLFSESTYFQKRDCYHS